MGAPLKRLVTVFRRARADRELDEEIRAHVELLAADYERQGMSPADARLAARRAFGGIEPMKERYRDRRGLPWLDVLSQDVLFAWRQMQRHPSVALVATLILGVSIGATVAVMTLVHSVVFRPLTYPEPDALVALHTQFPQFGRIPISDKQFRSWNGALRSFDSLALVWGYRVNMSAEGEPARVAGARITPSLLRMLGAQPQLGRLLRDDEDQPGRDRIVVLSDRIWRSHFNASRDIVGRTIMLDGERSEVVGVLPGSFHFPRVSRLYSIPVEADPPDVWKPLALAANDPFSGLNFAAVGRLADGVSIAQAQAELDAFQRSRPAGEGAAPVVLTSLREQITGTSRRGLEVLLAAVGIVLLVACINVTNLILARSGARTRELAVRAAVGATRSRLVRQLITEGTVLAVAGGTLGLCLAIAGVRLLVQNASIDLPRLDEVRVDRSVLQLAAVITAIATAIVAALPAWLLSRLSLRATLSRDHTATIAVTASRRMTTRSALVVAQLGAATACVVVAGLLLRSFAALLSVDKGFDAETVVTANLDLAGAGYNGRRVVMQRAMLERLRAIPGTTAVGFSSQPMLSGTGMNLRVIAEGTQVPPLERPLANIRVVSPDFFRVFRIPIQRGRVFGEEDSRPVAVVSASTAVQLWPGQDAIGKRLRRGPDTSAPIEIVGVAADVRASRLDQPAGPIVYLPFWQVPTSQVSLGVRTISDLASTGTAMRHAIRDLDPNLPIADLKSMTDVVDDAVAERRALTSMVALFACAALLLAAIGIYGVVSQAVAQRTPELGLRVALGAQRGELQRMVLGEAWTLLGIGLVLGLSGALLSSSALRATLFGVLPSDTRTYAVVSVLLAAVTTIAAYIPARRASRIDAMAALRVE